MKTKDLDNVLRIKEIMEHFHLNQRAFAERTGISKSNLSKILGGTLTCGPGTMNRVALAFNNINKDWVLYGVGAMLLDNNTTPTFSGDITVNGNGNSHIGHGQRNMPAIIEIKENGVEVECPNCGEIIEVAETALTPLVPHEVMLQPDTNLAQFVKKNPEKLSTINLAQLFGNDTIAIEIDTRAMEPEFKEGHFLMIRKLPDLSYARADGTAYVVDAIRPHALLRYLTRERDGSYVLTAENEKRTPIYLKAEEIYGIWQIEGGFWKRR